MGVVAGFARDIVWLRWDDRVGEEAYTDARLQDEGITKVTPADAVRKVGR